MKIYVLHHNRYWTEYLDFLIQEHYPIIASNSAVEPYKDSYPLNSMESFDPIKHQTIVSAGRLHDQTNQNHIVLRYLHSPGFYVYTMIKAYAELIFKHANSDYRFLVLEEYYRAMALRDIPDPKMDHFRYLMMNDPKVLRIETDPMMCRIKEITPSVKRKNGTGLLCPTWMLIHHDFSFFLHVIKTLRKEIEVNVLLHPLMRLDDQYMKSIYELQGDLIGKVYYNLPRRSLVDLYDEHEFIISNGSGACYEGMVRRCRPISIHFETDDVSENEVIEDIYHPFPTFEEIAKNKTFDSNAFINRFFPYLGKYTEKQASIIARDEVLKAADNMKSYQ